MARREELKKAIHELRSPYIYLWAIASPAITLLPPNNLVRVSLFILLLLGTTGYWLFDRHMKRRRIKPESSPAEFLVAIRRSVGNAVRYLEHAENKTEHDQRFRISPSVMETATVIGAITLGKHFLSQDHDNNERGLAWLFETLKSQFSGVALSEKLAGFDCSKCRGNNECNVAFFDYLSHFAYCGGTSLYDSFIEHFSLLGTTLKNRLLALSNDMAGWPAKNGDTVIDPLATSTVLHLCLILRSLNVHDIRRVVRWLIASQAEDGSWQRSTEAIGYCGGEYKVISTHRAIETLGACTSVAALGDFSNEIRNAVSKGAQYLASSPLVDAPVSYDLQAGYTSPEIYRTIGHVAQGLTKAGSLSSVVLREHISYVLNSQRDDGAFPTSSNLIICDRNLLHYTDITAFLIRTLIFYAMALRTEIAKDKGQAVGSREWGQIAAKAEPLDQPDRPQTALRTPVAGSLKCWA